MLYVCSGRWWLPERPDDIVAGSLEVTTELGGTLELIGAFDSVHAASSALRRPRLILGWASDGRAVTLYNCFTKRSTIGTGFPTEVYRANVVFVGHHFTTEADILFDTISCTYSNLGEWAGISGLQHAYEPQGASGIRKWNVTYQFPMPIAADIDGHIIAFDYIMNLSGNRVTSVTLNQATRLKVRFRQPISYRDIQQDIMFPLQSFLSLAMGIPVLPSDVRGTCKDLGRNIDGRFLPSDIDMFYALPELPPSATPFTSMEVLFDLDDISWEFDKYLSRWFDIAKTLRPVLGLYFAPIYSRTMYLENHFLDLAQAVESYHRTVFGGTYMSEQDYAPIRDRLIKSLTGVDSDFRDAMRTRIKYGLEYSLRKRLKELLPKVAFATNEVISNQAGFIGDVVDTRNYFTHYDSDLESRAKTGEALFELIQKLRVVLDACLLLKLDLPASKIGECVARRPAYRYLLQQQQQAVPLAQLVSRPSPPSRFGERVANRLGSLLSRLADWLLAR